MEDLENIRRKARSSMIESAKMAFPYVLSYENTTGALRANERFDQGLKAIQYIYEYVLAASKNETFRNSITMNGKHAYNYPTRDLYRLYIKWIEILWTMEKINDSWSKGRLYPAVVSGEIDNVKTFTFRCERELIKLRNAEYEWIDLEIVEELFSYLYGSARERRKELYWRKNRKLKPGMHSPVIVANIARTVVSMMAPVMFEHIISFKELVGGEVDVFGVSQMMESAKDTFQIRREGESHESRPET